MIRQLYAIERRIKDKTTEERYRVRQCESRPVMDKLRQWLEKQKPRILPESKLGKAITYALNQWPYLSRYLDSGLVEIDNNAAERSIKPYAWFRYALTQLPRLEKGAGVEHLLPINLTPDDVKIPALYS